MMTDVSRSRGRFWAIRDISGDGDCSNLEEAETAEATPLPTFGDALRRANDLRGSRMPRKDKQARYVALEERLRRCRALLRPTSPAASSPVGEPPPFRYIQHPCSNRHEFSPPCSDPDPESNPGDWFQIRGVKRFGWALILTLYSGPQDGMYGGCH
jgi:hypothetical protein